jgi:hypothetical protein
VPVPKERIVKLWNLCLFGSLCALATPEIHAAPDFEIQEAQGVIGPTPSYNSVIAYCSPGKHPMSGGYANLGQGSILMRASHAVYDAERGWGWLINAGVTGITTYAFVDGKLRWTYHPGQPTAIAVTVQCVRT